MSFWIGMTIGLFAGTFAGVLLTCILVASRRQPEPAPAFAVVRWEGIGDPAYRAARGRRRVAP